MKQGWEVKKLGDVCEYTKTPNKKKTLPYVGLEDIESNTGKFVGSLTPQDAKSLTFSFNDGCVLYGRLRPYLNKVLTPTFEGHCSTEIFPIKPKTVLNKRFLFHWLLADETVKKFNATCTGARMPRANMNSAMEFEFFLPPLSEQKRIVVILDEAFEAISKAKANAEKNLKNSKELFESYLYSVFANKCYDRGTLGKIATVIGGYSFKSGDFTKEGKYQVIRMGNVRPGIIRENESPVFIDKLDDNALKRALLLLNDVIITQTGTKKKRDYGFTVIIEEENYLLNQRISAIRFSNNYLPKFFLYYSWTNHFKDQYFANETGTVGQGNVGIGAITNAIIPFPSLSEQKSVVAKLDDLSAETKRLEAIYQKKISDLEELKKSILQKAFNGEL